MEVAALIIGLASAGLIFVFPPLAVPPAIVGIIISTMARKNEKTPMSTAGLILSVTSLVLGAICGIVCTACGVGLIAVLVKAFQMHGI